MSKTIFNQKLDCALNTIYSSLKEYDFKKRGSNFICFKNDTWTLLYVQRNKYNTAKEGNFTFNICLHFTSLDEKAISKYPPEYLCHLRSRIGRFMHPDESWFEITSNTNIDELAQHIASILLHEVLPFMMAINSEELFLKGLDNDVKILDKFWISWEPALDLCKRNSREDLINKIIDYKLSNAENETMISHLKKLRDKYCSI